MGKFDEKKQLVIGSFCVLLTIVAVNVWLLVMPNETKTIAPEISSEQDINQLPPTAADIPSILPLTISPSNHPQQSTSTDSLPQISAEMAKEIRLLSNPSEDPTASTNPDGSLSVDLNGHHRTVTAVVRGEDGKLIIRHGEEFLQNVKPK